MRDPHHFSNLVHVEGLPNDADPDKGCARWWGGSAATSCREQASCWALRASEGGLQAFLHVCSALQYCPPEICNPSSLQEAHSHSAYSSHSAHSASHFQAVVKVEACLACISLGALWRTACMPEQIKDRGCATSQVFATVFAGAQGLECG